MQKNPFLVDFSHLFSIALQDKNIQNLIAEIEEVILYGDNPRVDNLLKSLFQEKTLYYSFIKKITTSIFGENNPTDPVAIGEDDKLTILKYFFGASYKNAGLIKSRIDEILKNIQTFRLQKPSNQGIVFILIIKIIDYSLNFVNALPHTVPSKSFQKLMIDLLQNALETFEVSAKDLLFCYRSIEEHREKYEDFLDEDEKISYFHEIDILTNHIVKNIIEIDTFQDSIDHFKSKIA